MVKFTNLSADKQLVYLDSIDSIEGLTNLDPGKTGNWARSLPYGRLLNAIYPGFLAAGTVALAASWLSQHYGAPVMLFALLIGMTLNFLHQEGRCVAGVEFSSRTVLRIGVALLGARITVEQVASLGVVPIVTVIVAVASTVLLGVIVARIMGLQRLFGVLSAGSVAICGASAALAINSVLPQRKDGESDVILVVVAVTGLSTLAMIFYPLLATTIGLDHVRAGVFLGGTIHDVAQVVGAGYMISPETGDIATYVKLLRVAMLAPMVMAISFVTSCGNTEAGRRKGPLLPGFLIGFVALAALNSLGCLPGFAKDAAADLSRWCLVIAIGALGMKTSLQKVFAVGWRPIALMVMETFWIAALVLGSLFLRGAAPQG
jgi:uncharacterized integral membrane protein (TIGR00698 family)